MSLHAVWLDQQHSKVFKITADQISHETLTNKHIDHHTHNKKENKADHEHGSDGLYKETAQKLKGSDRILIIGPGLAKNHFKSYLEKHHQNDLLKKIIAVETTDQLTDNQIVAWVRDYFKHQIHE